MRFVYFVAVLCLLGLTAPLPADDFSSFRIPPHRLVNLTGSASGAFFNTRYRTYASPYYPSSQPNAVWLNNLDGELDGLGQWLYDSDPLRFNVEAGLNALGHRNNGRSTGGDTLVQRVQSTKQSYASTMAALNGDLRYYPSSKALGLYGAFSFTANYSGQWDHLVEDDYRESSVGSSRLEDANRWVLGRFDLNFGFGYGRVRDVTAVYDVQALEERLIGAGYLNSKLSPETRTRLMELFYVHGYYNTIHDRADKFFWRDVQTLLSADSTLLRKPLDAYALFRIAEGYLEPAYPDTQSTRFFPGEEIARFNLNRSRIFRQRGWFIGPVLKTTFTIEEDYYSSHQGDYVQDDTQPAEEYHTTDGWDDWTGHGEIWLGLRGEYHLPVGTRWQFDALSTTVSPWDEAGESGADFKNELRAAFLITDRWRGDVLLRHDRYYYSDDHNDYWKTIMAVGVRYYIEDHLSVAVSAEQFQGKGISLEEDARYGAPSGYAPQTLYPYNPIYQRVYQINIGLSYHFLGTLDAFGLVPQVSLMR